MSAGIYIHEFSLCCAQGADKAQAARAIFADPKPLSTSAALIDGRSVIVAALPSGAVIEGDADTRTNRILARLLRDLAFAPQGARPERVAVVIGTSTSGISEAPNALRDFEGAGAAWPANFRFERQTLGDCARFVAQSLGAKGPAYVVSTACTSGAKAIISGARLLQADLADVVICGGADALSELTLNGFSALDSVAESPCVPFSANRCGITLGEGGALFVLSRRPGPWRLSGWGESSDAHHISAPDPEGLAAESAARQALRRAGLSPGEIQHVHMHGTATRLNDQMEGRLVERLFGRETPASSTKALTGHTLGAAGAVQAAISLLAMEQGVYPPHVWDGAADEEGPKLRLTGLRDQAPRRLDHMMALNFAFGGSNAALVLGRAP